MGFLKGCRAVSLSLLTLTLLPTPGVAQTVDGDLSDLEILAQATATDLINDVCPVGKSGFDVERLLVYYDVLNDDLYIGLDLFDVPPGLGFVGAGVPGDADGDNDPSSMTNVACQVKVDQPGVGADETYVLAIDTDGDLSFETAADFRVEFRNNRVTLMRGDGTILPNDPQGLSALVVLGTAGAGGIDTDIPNQDQSPFGYENTLTEDIELVIQNFSLADPVPQCFRVQFFAGSLRDLLPEDKLSSPLEFSPFTPSVSLDKEARNVSQQGKYQDSLLAASPGDFVRFRLTVRNDGEIPLTDLVVEDDLPAGFAGLATADPGCVVNGNSLTCTVPSLGVGEAKVILYEAQVSAAPGAELINDARVVAQVPAECDRPAVSARDQVTVRVVGILCDKRVSINGTDYFDEATVATGQQVFYEVEVRNDSAVTLLSASVLDQLPDGLSDPRSDDPRVQIAGNLIFAFLGDLPAGATDVVRYRATVTAENPPTTSLVNTASVSGLADEILVTSECGATVFVPSVDIECDKAASLDGTLYSDEVVATPGQRVGFRVVVTNSGSAPLFDVMLRDELPPGFEAPLENDPECSFVGTTLECNLGTLGPGESETVFYSARVSAQANGDLTNSAQVSGTAGTAQNPGIVRQDSCVAVTRVINPLLECEKLLSVDGGNFSSTMEAVTGQNVTFLLRASNPGVVPVFDVVVLDDVPAGFGFLSSSDPKIVINGSVVTCTVGVLLPGESADCIFQAVVVARNPPSLELVNTATVSGRGGSPSNPGFTVADDCVARMPLLATDIACDKNASLDGASFADEVFALPGDTIFFEVIASNTGDAPFFQVSLEDILPAGFVNPVTDDPRCGFVGNTLTCDLGGLEPGASTRVTFRADVAQGAAGSLVNTASVTGTPGLPGNPGDPSSSTCDATVALVSPDVTCFKEASLSFAGPFSPVVSASPGQKVFFRVTIANDSDGDLTFDSVRLVDSLPAGFSSVEVLFGACSVAGSQVSCDDLGTLASGEQVSVLYSAIVSATNPPTAELVNTAVVEAIFRGSVVDTDECSARVGVGSPAIACTKLVSVDGSSFLPQITAARGQIVIFRVDVTNSGSEALFSVSLQDALPAGFENPLSLDGRCSFIGNTLTCDLGGLAPGGSTTVLYTANVRGDATGSLVNTAMMTGVPGTPGNPGSPVESSCSAETLVGSPSIDCVKAVSLNGTTFEPSVGAAPLQTVQYRVVITNDGNVSLFGVSLSDTLPAGLTAVQVIQGACTVQGNTVSCADLGTLAPGQSVTVIYRASLTENPPSDLLVNTAFVAATSGLPENPGESVDDSCQSSVDVLEVDLECDKEASLDGISFSPSLSSVAPGQLVTFRVTVRNEGEIRFRSDLSLTDVLPAGYGDVESLDGRCIVTGNTLSCASIGPLAPGQSTVVLYRARVSAEPPAQLVNTAVVAGISGTGANPGISDETSCSATVTVEGTGVDCTKLASLDGISFASSVSVLSGQDQLVTFRVAITNTGATPLFTVSLQDILPAGFADLVSLDGRCTASGSTLSCSELGPLASGESTSVDFRARVVATNPPTSVLVNTAQIQAVPGSQDNPGAGVADSCSAEVQILNAVLRCEKLVSANGVDFFPAVSASPGQLVTYRVEIFNDSSSPVGFDPVTLSDILPAELEDVEVLSAGCSAAGNTVTCNLGALAQGESAIVLYRARLGAAVPEGTVVVNTARVEGTALGVLLESSCSASVTAQPASAECTKLASLDGVTYSTSVEAAPGQRVRFRVTIRNTGTVGFSTVAFTDTLPADFEQVMAETAGCTVSGNTLSCADLGPLAVGGELVVEYRARVRPMTTAGSVLVNTASFTAIPGTPENPGGPVVEQCQAETLVQGLSVACDKSVSLDGSSFGGGVNAVPGQRVFFRVIVTNDGAADLFSVALTDVLPAGLVDPQTSTPGCSFVGSSLSCNLGPLAAGATTTVFFSAEVGTAIEGDLVNTAQVEARAGSVKNPSVRVADECSAMVTSLRPVLVCAKTVSLDGVSFSPTIEAVPGQLVFFRLVVSNMGAVRFFQVEVEDALPAGFVSPVATSVGCFFTGNTLRCSFGTLNPGVGATLTYQATVGAGASGTLVNTAVAIGTPGTADNPGDPVETSCSAQTQVRRPLLECLKEVSRDGVTFGPSVQGMVGQNVFYRVTVRNTGTVDFFDTALTDVLPGALVDVQTTDPDCVVTGNEIECDLGLLAAGAQRVVLYQARIGTLSSDIVNTASVVGVPGSQGNPGTPVLSSCSATVESGPRRIPTLSEWGLMILVALLGAGLVLRQRF